MTRFGLFRIGGFGFAVALEQIKKILQNSTDYSLPHLPGAVAAVLVDGGELVPLLDLSLLAGAESQLSNITQGYRVLVKSEYGIVALPADLSGKIVAEEKCELSATNEQKMNFGIIGKFIYQSEEYSLLDINFLALEMTQDIWQNQFDTGGARRHK